MSDTRAIKPEDNKGGTFTQQLTIAEVTTAYVSPVPAEAPGVITAEPGTDNEEAIHFRTKDAGAGTISGLTRDYTNLSGGTGIQHENSEDWEIYQNAFYVANLVDILTEGYLREQQAIARTGDTTLTVVGNVAALYTANRVLRSNGDNNEVVTIVSSSYSAGTGLTTVTITGTLPNPLTYVEIGIQPKAAAFASTTSVVLLTGDQTIAGVKTFSSSPVVPAPTTDLQAATKKYVDDNAGAGGKYQFIIPGTAVAGTDVAGTWFVPEAGAIESVSLYADTAGDTGSTVVDVNLNGTSVFPTATKPTLTTTGTEDEDVVPDTTAIAQGDKITIDIDSITTTAQQDLYVIIKYS